MKSKKGGADQDAPFIEYFLGMGSDASSQAPEESTDPQKRLKPEHSLVTVSIWLNRSDLGCKTRVQPMHTYRAQRSDRRHRLSRDEWVNLVGTAKDGKAIFIEFEDIKTQWKAIPQARRDFMLAQEKLGAIVGVAYDFSDAYDIVSGTKRKKRTFNHWRIWDEEKQNDVYSFDQPGAGHKPYTGGYRPRK